MSKRDRKVAFREEVDIPEKRQKNEGEELDEEELEQGRSEWALFRILSGMSS